MMLPVISASCWPLLRASFGLGPHWAAGKPCAAVFNSRSINRPSIIPQVGPVTGYV